MNGNEQGLHWNEEEMNWNARERTGMKGKCIGMKGNEMSKHWFYWFYNGFINVSLVFNWFYWFYNTKPIKPIQNQ